MPRIIKKTAAVKKKVSPARGLKPARRMTKDVMDPDGPLAEALKTIAVHKKTIKSLNNVVTQLEEQAIAMMREAGIAAMPGYGALVEGIRTDIDVVKLEKLLTPAQWKAVTYRALDRDRLTKAVASGKIDPKTVLRCTGERPVKAYIRTP